MGIKIMKSKTRKVIIFCALIYVLFNILYPIFFRGYVKEFILMIFIATYAIILISLSIYNAVFKKYDLAKGFLISVLLLLLIGMPSCFFGKGLGF